MSTLEAATEPATEAPAPTRRRRPPVSVLLAVVVLVTVLAFAVVPSLFSTQSPIDGVARDKLASPSGAHLLGTDYLGRDLFSRIVHGARTSVLSALLAVAVAFGVGTLAGLSAALGPRWLATVILRIVDMLLAVPSLLLAMVFVSAFGYSTTNAAAAVGLAMVATCARVSRIEALRVLSAPYIEAAELSGGRRHHVVFGHLLPNIATTLISLAVLDFGFAILQISTLSFLGFGTQPPDPEWGKLVAEGADYFYSAPWLVYLPAVAVVVVVLAVNRLSTYLDARAFNESL